MKKSRFTRLVASVAFMATLGLSNGSFAADAGAPSAVALFDGGAPVVVDSPVSSVSETPEVVPVTPTVTPAAEQGSALSKLSSDLMDVVIPSLITLVGLLFAWVLNLVRKKLHLNVSDQQIYQWSLLAEKAAARGAEWARNKAKTLTEGQKVPGPDVLEVAVDWAVEMGRALKLPEMGREKLIGLIEGHLSQSRTNALLFTTSNVRTGI